MYGRKRRIYVTIFFFCLQFIIVMRVDKNNDMSFYLNDKKKKKEM